MEVLAIPKAKAEWLSNGKNSLQVNFYSPILEGKNWVNEAPKIPNINLNPSKVMDWSKLFPDSEVNMVLYLSIWIDSELVCMDSS